MGRRDVCINKTLVIVYIDCFEIKKYFKSYARSYSVVVSFRAAYMNALMISSICTYVSMCLCTSMYVVYAYVAMDECKCIDVQASVYECECEICIYGRMYVHMHENSSYISLISYFLNA